jgi:hypothetical protein
MVSQRCFSCNKKVGLLGFDCRCNNIYCSKCRYPEDHSCIFDHKNYGRELLKTELVKVVPKKIKEL